MRRVIARVEGHNVSLQIVDHPATTAVCLDHSNVVRRGDDFVYLDVGRWGGTDRYFGVAYGDARESYVAVCEYAGRADEVRSLPGQTGAGQPARTVISFLNACHSRVVEAGRFQSVDTAGKLYLFLGDLHLPVVSELCSIWRNRGRDLPEVQCRVDQAYMRSLAPQSLSDFFSLDGIVNSGLVSPTAGVDALRLDFIHEWYRLYLANDIFTHPRPGQPDEPRLNDPAEDLKDFLNLAQQWEPADEADAESTGSAPVHFVQLGDMYELWVGLKRQFSATSPSRREVRIGGPPCRGPDYHTAECRTHSQGECASRRSLDIIRNWLDMVHETTTIMVNERPVSLAAWLHSAMTFRHTTWLTGNHDNYLRPLAESMRLPRRSMNLYENHVLVEHGHEGDEYNRDGATDGHDITQGGAFLWNLRPLVALGEDSQRRGFLGYSVRKFVDPDIDIKLFAMAHTHLPYLATVTIGHLSR